MQQTTRVVRRGIVVLIDDLHGHEALAWIGQRDGNRRGIQVEDAGGIKRVAIHPHHGLLVDGRHVAVMVELTEASGLHRLTEITIAFSAAEVTLVDGQRRAGCRRLSDKACSGIQREHEGQKQKALSQTPAINRRMLPHFRCHSSP